MKCVIVIEEEPEQLRHLESVLSTSHLTLCGFTDLPHRFVDGIPNCPVCLDVVNYGCKMAKMIKRETKCDKNL